MLPRVDEWHSLQDEIISIQTVRSFAFDAFDLHASKARLDNADDAHCNLVLESEDIVERPIIALGPDMGASLRLNELAGDADTISCLAHTTLQHIAHTKFAGDSPYVQRLGFVDEAGIPGDDEQPLDAREPGDDVLHHPVRKIFLL